MQTRKQTWKWKWPPDIQNLFTCMLLASKRFYFSDPRRYLTQATESDRGGDWTRLQKLQKCACPSSCSRVQLFHPTSRWLAPVSLISTLACSSHSHSPSLTSSTGTFTSARIPWRNRGLCLVGCIVMIYTHIYCICRWQMIDETNILSDFVILVTFLKSKIYTMNVKVNIFHYITVAGIISTGSDKLDC